MELPLHLEAPRAPIAPLVNILHLEALSLIAVLDIFLWSVVPLALPVLQEEAILIEAPLALLVVLDIILREVVQFGMSVLQELSLVHLEVPRVLIAHLDKPQIKVLSVVML
jgi:hypothetical protein